MEYQTSLTQGQPDDEAVRLLQYYEALALENDPRGYCVCTSEGKDSRVLGHLFRRAGVKHFYQHSITGIDPPELIYFQRSNFQQYRDAGYVMTGEREYGVPARSYYETIARGYADAGFDIGVLNEAVQESVRRMLDEMAPEEELNETWQMML